MRTPGSREKRPDRLVNADGYQYMSFAVPAHVLVYAAFTAYARTGKRFLTEFRLSGFSYLTMVFRVFIAGEAARDILPTWNSHANETLPN